MSTVLRITTATEKGTQYFNNLAKNAVAVEPTGLTNALKLGIDLEDYEGFLADMDSAKVEAVTPTDRRMSEFHVTLNALSETTKAVMHQLLAVNNRIGHSHIASAVILDGDRLQPL